MGAVFGLLLFYFNMEHIMAEAKKKSAPKLANYKNSTRANIFTEGGRCPPQGIVALLPAQAEAYQGLELCKQK
jgi:hypothetical protein